MSARPEPAASLLIHALATAVSTLFVVGLAYAAFCAPGLFDSLRTAEGTLSGFWRTALHLVPLGTLLLLTVPGWLADVALSRSLSWRRRGLIAAVGVTLALFFSLADHYLYRTFGRHLLGPLAYLDLPEGAQATRSAAVWLGGAADDQCRNADQIRLAR